MAAMGVAALAGAAWYYRNEWMNLLGLQRAQMTPERITPEVKEQLPIAKDLKTIPDQEANYDIDGVSFDSEGVVVGSDREFETEEMKQVRH
jgi:hypothetical protein